MSISSEITRISNNISAAYTSISNKGGVYVWNMSSITIPSPII